MLSLPPSVRIFVARAPTDMRKAFDGLSGLVNDVIREDVFSGHLFVFVNRRKDRVKVLWWDRTGFWLLYKRLEKGTLPMQWLSFGDQECVEMTSSELTAFLEGIDLRRAKRLPRYDDGRMSGAPDVLVGGEARRTGRPERSSNGEGKVGRGKKLRTVPDMMVVANRPHHERVRCATRVYSASPFRTAGFRSIGCDSMALT